MSSGGKSSAAILTLAGRFLESNGTNVGVVDAEGERVITLTEFCERLDVDGWVRMHPNDFAAATVLQQRVTHFNLATTSNQIGRRYALVPIIRAGYRSADGVEVLPFVGLEDALKARCIEVRQNVQINDFRPGDFQHSLPTVRSQQQLRSVLIDRYGKLHPGLDHDELLRQGCAISTFEFYI